MLDVQASADRTLPVLVLVLVKIFLVIYLVFNNFAALLDGFGDSEEPGLGVKICRLHKFAKNLTSG